MNKNRLNIILGGVFVLLGLIATTYLVKQNQDLNKSASGGDTGLTLLPGLVEKKVGEEFSVQVMINSGDKGVDTLKTKICFNKNNVGLVNVSPVSNIINSNVFNIIDASVSEDGDNKCLTINALNTATISASQGEIYKLFDIKFKALMVSEGNISIDAGNTEVWGLNSAGEKYQVLMNVLNGSTYKITTNDIATEAKIYLSPSSVNKLINDEFVSEIKVESNKSVNSMRFYFCFQSDLLRLVDQTTINNNFVVDGGVLDSVISSSKITEGENTCYDVILSKLSGQLNTAVGVVKIADIKLKAVKAGSGLISINKDKCEIGGQTIGLVAGANYSITQATATPTCTPQCSNKCGGSDGCGGTCPNICNSIQTCVNNVCVTKTQPTPTCTPQCSGKCSGSDGCNGTCPNICNSIQTCVNNICVARTVNDLTLKYKVSFVGVKPSGSDPNCTSNWPLTFTILDSAGISKNYISVPTKTAATNNVNIDGEPVVVSIFEGTVNLTDLQSKSGLSVFIKGPRHLQMKYGRDDQITVYDRVSGGIDITDQTLVHDFSKYPILAGDVNDDGMIDGRDYVLIKTELASGNLGEEVANSPLDLDGNCLINAGDSTILKMSLVEKQGQLY